MRILLVDFSQATHTGHVIKEQIRHDKLNMMSCEKFQNLSF